MECMEIFDTAEKSMLELLEFNPSLSSTCSEKKRGNFVCVCSVSLFLARPIPLPLPMIEEKSETHHGWKKMDVVKIWFVTQEGLTSVLLKRTPGRTIAMVLQTEYHRREWDLHLSNIQVSRRPKKKNPKNFRV